MFYLPRGAYLNAGARTKVKKMQDRPEGHRRNNKKKRATTRGLVGDKGMRDRGENTGKGKDSGISRIQIPKFCYLPAKRSRVMTREK